MPILALCQYHSAIIGVNALSFFRMQRAANDVIDIGIIFNSVSQTQ